jgi:hypothetical protein
LFISLPHPESLVNLVRAVDDISGRLVRFPNTWRIIYHPWTADDLEAAPLHYQIIDNARRVGQAAHLQVAVYVNFIRNAGMLICA